jgi:tRNA (guanine37-N1)-methyltransferase
MRHLSVPSKETSLWRDRLASNGWLVEGLGIHNLGDRRGIPINDAAPQQIDNLEIVILEPLRPGPKHWTERLDAKLFSEHRSEWPMSHDQIGDVIIVKVPNTLEKHSTAIGEAMLKQNTNARIVCADKGVKGQFRVRDLEVIASNQSDETITKVRESGHEFWVDPGAAYYSPRLANERLATVDCAKELSLSLGRKISVCDPYAGVGPALVPLSNTEAVDEIYASDLNPEATKLLKRNLPGHWVECRDAISLCKELPECCDLLLVNLPHDSVGHLPKLLGLLRKGHEVVIRGWAIIPLDSLADVRKRIISILSDSEIVSLEIEANRSYSPNDTYACFEAHIIRN